VALECPETTTAADVLGIGGLPRAITAKAGAVMATVTPATTVIIATTH
jgi:hypothetical protein